MKKRIIIIGGGFGGITAMHALKKQLGHEVEVILIDYRANTLNKPRLPDVAIKGESIEHARFLMKKAVKQDGYNLIQETVKKIDAKNQKVFLSEGGIEEYDYLILATGVEKHYSGIEGFTEFGYSVCDDVQAPRLYRRLQKFKGGPVFIGSMPYKSGTRIDAPKLLAPCEGPVGEVMFMLQEFLTKKGLVESSPITAFSPAKIFFEDVGDAVRNDVGAIMKKEGIGLMTGKIVSKIDEKRIYFEDGTSELCALPIILPQYKPYAFLEESGLTDDAGFIPTDKQMRHLDFNNIFAAGDATALSVPKLGHIAVIQAEIAAKTIAADLGKKVEIPAFDPAILCVMERSNLQATMIYSNVLYGGKRDETLNGMIAFMMKWGFDFYYNFTRGHMPPEFAEKRLVQYLSKK
ncbi:NAD(P)/FAD-dependent oxidoreductase [Prolixibacter sp. SD074]|jgi:sulfide:quinone oxidoreductase|uniref:NAD(P)/FAD-dependent oxidoreductase n=1 Tax=Prolixibacter sp. SD074 TaxID=2652391 RepID=UPI00127B0E32|nr:FAD-dependent oxidoreductase [Prolixibacter sp. SD074]GET29428.1 pyridine nucleotide-disulfide oxidoreductase [Prolixibacter sp. SD074]